MLSKVMKRTGGFIGFYHASFDAGGKKWNMLTTGNLIHATLKTKSKKNVLYIKSGVRFLTETWFNRPLVTYLSAVYSIAWFTNGKAFHPSLDWIAIFQTDVCQCWFFFCCCSGRWHVLTIYFWNNAILVFYPFLPMVAAHHALRWPWREHVGWNRRAKRIVSCVIESASG